MSEFDRRRHPPGMMFWDWRAPDGWLLRRMDWPRPAGTAPQGSLLFAGGRGDFVEKYLEPIGHWHRRGWNVASFDWRGQGKSKGEMAGDVHSFDPMLDDLDALVLDWLGLNPGPHFVIGHSMGGHMVLRLLVERPPAIDGAVLTAPMIAVNSGAVPLWLARALAAAASLAGLARRPVWGSALARGPAGSRRQRALTRCPSRYEDELHWWTCEPGFAPVPPSFGWLRAAFRSARTFSPARLAGVRVPVLLVAAERDRLVSTAAIRRVAALVPHAEYATFDGAHELLRETDETRLAVMDRIDAFLDERAR